MAYIRTQDQATRSRQAGLATTESTARSWTPTTRASTSSVANFETTRLGLPRRKAMRCRQLEPPTTTTTESLLSRLHVSRRVLGTPDTKGAQRQRGKPRKLQGIRRSVSRYL